MSDWTIPGTPRLRCVKCKDRTDRCWLHELSATKAFFSPQSEPCDSPFCKPCALRERRTA